MSWPQHKEPREHSASAPYNFVPLPEAILTTDRPFAAHDRLDPNRLHGVVELTLTTETELYTRCAYPPAVHDRKVIDTPERQEHFHRGDPSIPVIPGSTLRGAIRNLVEILSYSRLTRRESRGRSSRVIDERLIHRAVADVETRVGKAYAARFLRDLAREKDQKRLEDRRQKRFEFPSSDVRAGYLEEDSRGGWQIRPAREHVGCSFVRVDARQLLALGISVEDVGAACKEVWVVPARSALRQSKAHPNLSLQFPLADVFDDPGADRVRGLFVPTGHAPTRHYGTVVYEKNGQAPAIPISEDMWAQWEADRDLHRGLANREVRKGDPIFYLTEKGVLTFFGPPLFFRIPHTHFTLDFVPRATLGSASAPLDFAEAIFGTVNEGERKTGDSSSGSHRGRVFFEDAVSQARNPFLERHEGRRYPSVLSAPKPTSYQLYLVQPLDLGVEKKSRLSKLLAFSDAPPDSGKAETTVLRGYKRYWHRGPVRHVRAGPTVEQTDGSLHESAPESHETQFTRIRPVRPGTVFKGRIRFENLTSAELGALMTALSLPEGSRHQLGMGKPLGMGSTRIEADLRLFDPVARYSSLSSGGWLENAPATLEKARADFGRIVVDHHNRHVDKPKAADLWQIPRMAALRLLLRYDGRPTRELTRPQGLASFRERKVLGSPFGVAGEPTPAVQAPLPVAPAETAQTAPSSGALSGAQPTTPRAQPTPTGAQARLETQAHAGLEKLGRITQSLPNFVEVTPNGEAPQTLPKHRGLFPPEAWGPLNERNLPPGKAVRLIFEGTKVKKVLPK